MYHPRNASLAPRARELRRDSTEAERRLWAALRPLKPRWRRQEVFGRYIIDFYCSAAKLAVELDGAQHFQPEQAEYDRRRTAFLEEHGLCVLRVDDHELMTNFTGVCDGILDLVEKRASK
ncbi:MAG: endonuclease domain-containing protein [Candidatus Heteroscillospira sp.]|jgi:very-short-patch-repair endonuclease